MVIENLLILALSLDRFHGSGDIQFRYLRCITLLPYCLSPNFQKALT